LIALSLSLPTAVRAQESESDEQPTGSTEDPAAEDSPEGELESEPVLDPEFQKLLNSQDRDWVLPAAPGNPAKGGSLPLNSLTLSVATPPADDPEAAISDLDAALGQDDPVEVPRARFDVPNTWLITAPAFSLTGGLISAALRTHWAEGNSEAGTLGMLLGSAGGAVAGVGVAAFLDPQGHEATALLGGSLIGAWTGYELSRLAISEDDKHFTERTLAWSSLGNLAGIATSFALEGHLPASSTTTGAILATTVGWQLGAGIADFRRLDPNEDRRPRAAWELGFGYAFGAGLGTAHHFGFDLPDPTWATLGVIEGAWIGAWLPWAIANQPTDQQRLGSLRIGVAGGYLASLGVSRVLEPSPKILGMQALGFSIGTLLGAGIPLSTPIEGYPRQAVIPLLIGGVGGQVIGTVIAPRYHLKSQDGLMIGVLSAWTAYQMVGWGLMASEQGLNDRRTTGIVLTTAGAGTLVAWGMPALFDSNPRQSVLIVTSSLWGTWYGAWSGYLLRARPAQTWTATLAVGDLALLGMAGVTAAGLDPSWRQIGLVNAAGAAGAGFGALIGVLASPDPRTVGFASLLGTTAGLAGGTLLAVLREPQESEDAATLSWLGIRRPRLQRVPFTVMPMAAPWVSDDGDIGVMVQLSAFEREVGR
jgi:hypothetical protein